jgi:hypothetical protein
VEGYIEEEEGSRIGGGLYGDFQGCVDVGYLQSIKTSPICSSSWFFWLFIGPVLHWCLSA